MIGRSPIRIGAAGVIRCAMILAVLGFGHGAHAQTRVALSLYPLEEGKLAY